MYYQLKIDSLTKICAIIILNFILYNTCINQLNGTFQ